MSEDLKLCPFCGGKAYLHDIDSIQGTGPAFVECGTCSVIVESSDGSPESAITAWNRRARPSSAGEKVEADKEALIDFLINYGGRCRDCADEDGFCPRTGIGCGQRRQAAVFFVSALEYGSKHGFAGGYTLVSAATIAALEAERDEALKRARAHGR